MIPQSTFGLFSPARLVRSRAPRKSSGAPCKASDTPRGPGQAPTPAPRAIRALGLFLLREQTRKDRKAFQVFENLNLDRYFIEV